MTDIGKENIGILDEISLQLDFLLESEPVLWRDYQHGSSITVQTSGAADTRASQLERKCTVSEFPSRVKSPPEHSLGWAVHPTPLLRLIVAATVVPQKLSQH